MEIALLNLPIDNNYGGNLQRYALVKTLQDMGHDVEHLNLRFDFTLPLHKRPMYYAKRLCMCCLRTDFRLLFYLWRV